MSTIIDQERKMREMILYVCKESADDPAFGATKLNKILFFADFLAYELHGKAITGMEYQKLPYGPAPRLLMPIHRELESRGELVIEMRPCGSKMQKRSVAQRDPNTSVFSKDELELLNEVIHQLTNRNATEVSRLSHRFSGWDLAEEGETIPYEVALIDDPGPLSPEELAYAQQFLPLADQLAGAA